MTGRTTRKTTGKGKARSARSGEYVSRGFAKEHPATTVVEKTDNVLWSGWLINDAADATPQLQKSKPRDGGGVKVKLVRA